MSDSHKDPRASVRQKAQKHFTSAEQRDANLHKELENQRASFAAKSARLKALRLAKEAADNATPPAPEDAPKIKRTRTPRMKRITL